MINNIWVFDRDFNKIHTILSYISFDWCEEYQGRGLFTLYVGDSPENIEKIQEEYFLYMTDKKVAMVIKYKKLIRENQKIEMHGYTTLELIDQRGLLGIKRFGNVEAGMREALIESLRGLPRIGVAPLNGYPEAFSSQYSNRLLLDIFPELCAQTELGIRMLFDYKNGQHLFDVYRGVDRTFGQHENIPVIFSDDWGTLTNAVVVDDKSNFKNVAYVFGMGEGEERIMVEVGTAQGIDRYELFVDARDLQIEEDQSMEDYEDILRARGIAKLNEHNRRTSFTSEVNPVDFGVKYNLGDKVTCKSNRYGITLNARIMQYRQLYENNMIKVFLTLGEPEITLKEELKLWLS